ncbi:hypothetical protein [Kribbella sp. NPDC049227]|uniref:hypothetical protein n=1 Tax=Kribbella sp. NPDC049227 TaxID=3364113 RepID=UPI00371CA288
MGLQRLPQLRSYMQMSGPTRSTARILAAGSALAVLGFASVFQNADLMIRQVVGFEEGAAAGSVNVVVAGAERGLGGSYSVREDDGSLLDDQSARSSGRPVGGDVDCAGRVCFRVVPGRLAVESSRDGGRTYAIAWENNQIDVAALKRHYKTKYSELTPLSASSRAVTVRPQPDGGYVVLVANGIDGLLYRDPDGQWQRLGIPDNGPGYFYDPPPRVRSDNPAIPYGWIVASCTLVVLLVAGLTWPGPRSIRRRPLVALELVMVAGLLAVSGAEATQVPYVGEYPGFFYSIPLIGGLIIVGLVHSQVLSTSTPSERWPPDPPWPPLSR